MSLHKRLMHVQATPTFGDVEHGGATAVAQNRPDDEDGGSQRGGPLEARLAALLRGADMLVVGRLMGHAAAAIFRGGTKQFPSNFFRAYPEWDRPASYSNKLAVGRL